MNKSSDGFWGSLIFLFKVGFKWRGSMSYQVELGINNEIPLPDDVCRELNFVVGDILIWEKLDAMDQSLTDAEIESAGSLACDSSM